MVSFFTILIIGVFLVVAQGIASYKDLCFTQKQMKWWKSNSVKYSFLQHGGMWVDFFLVSPAIAFIVSTYDLHYLSLWSIIILISVIVVTIKGIVKYELRGIYIPEAHTYNGKTTVAGWIHGIYAILAMWVFILFLVTPITPVASSRHLLWVALILTFVFYLGVIKFNHMWRWSREDAIEATSLTISVWLIAITRVIFVLYT